MKPGYQPCSECCACNAPTFIADAIASVKSKWGWTASEISCDPIISDSKPFFEKKTYGVATAPGSSCSGLYHVGSSPVGSSFTLSPSTFTYLCDGTLNSTGSVNYLSTDYQKLSLSDEVSSATLLACAVSLLPAYSGIFNTTPIFSGPYDSFGDAYFDPRRSHYLGMPGAWRIGIQSAKYKIQHPLSKKTRSSRCYRVKWCERFVPDLDYSGIYMSSVGPMASTISGGASIGSIEVLKGGLGYVGALASCYVSAGAVSYIVITRVGNGYISLPSITIAAPDESGGVTATAHMETDFYDGSWVVVVDTPGSGYSRPPVVTISPPSGGVAPSIVISAPYIPAYLGSSSPITATATATLASDGTIASVAITNAGALYLDRATITVVPDACGLGSGAVLMLHYGTETEKTYQWDGVVPSGYTDNDSSTWPVSGEYPLDVPASKGRLFLDNVRYYCDGCS